MKPNNLSLHENNYYYRPDNRDANEIKNIILRFLYNWHWFLLTIGTAVILAFFYIRYTPPVYEIQATLLVSEDNSNSPLTALYGRNQGMFQERQITDWTNVNNQVAILGSTPIVSMTLSELDFSVSYYSLGRVSKTEMYKNAPFRIQWDKNHPQIIEGNFNLTINPDRSLTISFENENVRIYDYQENRILQMLPEYSFRAEIQPDSCLKTDAFCFTVSLNENFTSGAAGNYLFRFHTPESLTQRYRSMLKVALTDINSSILHLSVRDNNVIKGIDLLNKLIDIYQVNNLERKNQNANLTIQFIDSQLQNISDSLSISETRLESFRSANRMIDFSAQSQQLLMQMNELDKELMERETQHKYYMYLKNYIDSNQDLETVIAPSSVGIDDPLLNNFITQLNELINKKSGMTSIRPNSGHPTFIQLNNQIETVKKSLSQSINNIISQSKAELETLVQRMQKYNAQISRLPATERNFVNFERKYQIDSETYTFLLQKLSEARIVKASNLPDGQILEYPQLKAVVKPQHRKVFSFALMIGMMLPAAFILIGDFFNNKIRTPEDIKNLTSFPMLGMVFHEETRNAGFAPVMDNPTSRTANSFVSIRAKLKFMVLHQKHPVIAVTSALPKEGKTFSAINLASSVALTSKTAVVLDLDLRNSKMAEIFNLPQDNGVVNYVEGTAILEDITYNTPLERLKIIPAGRVPQNPSEVFSDIRLIELLEKLRHHYDLIVIDTPPIIFVSEIFQLADSIDFNILVVRHNYTPKSALKMALAEINDHRLKKTGIIFNSLSWKSAEYSYRKYGIKKWYSRENDSLRHNGIKEKLQVTQTT
jgi:tyrosine-protein kinase Etk/Wzc